MILLPWAQRNVGAPRPRRIEVGNVCHSACLPSAPCFGHILPTMLGVGSQSLLFGTGEVRWDRDIHMHEQIAPPAAPQTRNTHAGQPEDRTGLRPGRHFEFRFASLEQRDGGLESKGGLCQPNVKRVVKVDSISFISIIGPDPDLNLEITGGRSPRSRLTLTGDPQSGAI